MEIFKFGGTSVGNATNIKRVADIVNTATPKFVVLSANGKTTDILSAFIRYVSHRRGVGALESIGQLEKYYMELRDALNLDTIESSEFSRMITELITLLKGYIGNQLTEEDRDFIITRGEVISTRIFSLVLQSKGVDHQLVFAEDLIELDEYNKPDETKLQQRLQKVLKEYPSVSLFVTQGFMCKNAAGAIATLGRGGSDFTASLLGAAVGASVIQIWSDVDGFLNNDPGFVRGALPLQYLSFDEAAELAYFGARVLHPATIYPAKKAGIPVLLKNTNNPSNPGTVISEKKQTGNVKAVAAKDGIYSITIHSHQMLMAYGFLRKVFEVFEKYETPVDMVTTSEVSVSVTVDNPSRIKEIISELEQLGEVLFAKDLSLVCVVGDHLADNKGKVMEVFDALKNIPVKMISYGAAKNSIAFLVDQEMKVNALEALNRLLVQSHQKEMAYV